MINAINKPPFSKYYNAIWYLIGIIYSIYLLKLNYIHIFDNAFWGDETYTLWLSRMSVSEMLKTTAADVHPPLHYLLEILLVRLLGSHGYVYHLGAYIPFAASVLFIILVLWRDFGKEVSLLMLTFVGLCPNAVRFNVEARMYSLAFFFVLISSWGFFNILKNNIYDNLCIKWPYFVFILGSLGAAYSHYYGALSVAFFYLGLLFFTIPAVNHSNTISISIYRLPIKTLLCVYIATIVGYLPWLFQMLSTFERTANDFWMKSVTNMSDSIQFYYP